MDGHASLVVVTAEAAGANCANGGQRIDAGVDLDDNGTLDDGNVISTYVCNGADGADGRNGADGAPGADGEDGEPGARGPSGKDGGCGCAVPKGSPGAPTGVFVLLLGLSLSLRRRLSRCQSSESQVLATMQ